MHYFEVDELEWPDVDSLKRYEVANIASLIGNVDDVNNHLYYANTYVLYRDDVPVYVRGTDKGLSWRLEKDFAINEAQPKKSDLFRRVAKHLSIAFPEAIKQGAHRLTDDELHRIREWLEECEIVFLSSPHEKARWFAARLAKIRRLALQADEFDQELHDELDRERESHEYKRKRKRIDYVAIFVGIVLSSLIGARLMYPFQFMDATYTYPWLGGQSIFQFLIGLFIAPWIVIPIYAWSVDYKEMPLSQSTPLIALGLPVILIAGWMVVLKPEHDRQRDSFDAFARYFHRIPDSKLGPPVLVDQNQFDHDLTTVCADLGKQDGTDFICADLYLDRPRGKQVVGGFQTRTIHVVNEADDGYTGNEYIVVYDAHDCWGRSSECEY